ISENSLVILRPEEMTQEAMRKDFAQTVEHLTNTLFIRCALVETRSLAKTSSYLGAVLNMVA
ncbi:MAG TPA: hypothetical protein PLL10_07720, partial [Elusimicrobiales bacterium]|nr:hypothetical protein [Elusimicrobiales bacterium]